MIATGWGPQMGSNATKTEIIDIASGGVTCSDFTVRKIVLKLLLYLYFRTKVLKFRHDILIK